MQERGDARVRGCSAADEKCEKAWDARPKDELSDALANINLYMGNLANTHHQTTQTLTYMNHISKIENQLLQKLNADKMKTNVASRDIQNVIHKTRQEYMDKEATVFYNYMIVGVMQVTIVIVILSFFTMELYLSGAIAPALYWIIMVGLAVFYFLYLYQTLSLNSMRMRSRPSTLIFNRSSFFNNSNKCNANGP
jgi:cation transport ATPase